MTDKLTDAPAAFGIRALFACMNEEYTGNMVNRVLNSLGRASPEAKRSFQTELDKLNLRVPGFRNASVALRSNPQRLKDPVRRGLIRSDDLAAAALKVWAESQQDLLDIVKERIDDVGRYIGVSAEYPDFSDNSLRGHWPKEGWERESDRFAQLDENLDEDDIALMMCYVSGKLPGMDDSEQKPDPMSEAVRELPDILKLLALCAVDLENLPVSAPEWESDIPKFADQITKTVAAKREERNRAATLDSFIAEIRDDFSPELAYMEADTAAWSAASLPGPDDIAKALDTCEQLRAALSEYRSIRESTPATTRTEERERRDKNDQLEDLIESLLDAIARLMAGEPMPENDPPRKPSRARQRTESSASAQVEPPAPPAGNVAPVSRHPQAFPDFDLDHLAHENMDLKSRIDEGERENEALRAEVRRLENENETLRSENRTLANDVQFLRADKSDIERNVEALQSRLTARENDAETWRLAYEEESRIPRMTVKDVPTRIENVSDAVRYAEDMFPDRLLLKTNSKSQVRDNPFEKPEDVWEALKWLATSYRDARAGVSSVPDFDLSVREACGWQYKSDQHETTRNKYREWYTTKTNNKTYWLLEHIGTGASKDARHTIRVAFDWDKDEKLVVVGYIGQHQRTDAT